MTVLSFTESSAWPFSTPDWKNTPLTLFQILNLEKHTACSENPTFLFSHPLKSIHEQSHGNEGYEAIGSCWEKKIWREKICVFVVRKTWVYHSSLALPEHTHQTKYKYKYICIVGNVGSIVLSRTKPTPITRTNHSTKPMYITELLL